MFTGWNTAGMHGGGFYFANSHATISFTRVHNNIAYVGGGGYTQGGSSPLISNCLFYENFSKNHGSAMYLESSAPSVNFTSFYANSAFAGATVYSISSSPSYHSCSFFSNTATYTESPAMMTEKGNITLSSCTFYNHTSDRSAVFSSSPSLIFRDTTFSSSRGVRVSSSVLRMDNCTIADNMNLSDAGLFICANSNFEVTNSIISRNSGYAGTFLPLPSLLLSFFSSLRIVGTFLLASEFHYNQNTYSIFPFLFNFLFFSLNFTIDLKYLNFLQYSKLGQR